MRVGVGCPDLLATAGGLSADDYITLPLLDRAGFFHFFGTRTLGNPAERFNAGRVLRLRQVHGDQIVAASENGESGPEEAVGDGWVTHRTAVLVTISTADCLPLILMDPDSHAVSALHAGWRGTLLNIAARGVATMQHLYGSRATSLLVGMGPRIGRCCFEVGRDVWEPIGKKYSYGTKVIMHHNAEKAYLDLARLNQFQLIEAGVLPERIASVDLCTVCHVSRFYSYRRDKTHAGSMISGVMLK